MDPKPMRERAAGENPLAPSLKSLYRGVIKGWRACFTFYNIWNKLQN
jgi:hypothetical protein